MLFTNSAGMAAKLFLINHAALLLPQIPTYPLVMASLSDEGGEQPAVGGSHMSFNESGQLPTM